MQTQSIIVSDGALDAKQQSTVIISAFTAKGDLPQLKTALTAGLDAGLSINEIKDMLIQLYAYCGFPRSLNAITTLMALLDERKEKGIVDVVGKETSPITDITDKYETGRKTLEILTKRPEQGPKTGVAAFAPIADTFLKEHLFADIFSRDILTYFQRELVTISALMSTHGLEPQLTAHISMGMNVGITASQVNQVTSIIQTNIGETEGNVGKSVLLNVTEAK